LSLRESANILKNIFILFSSSQCPLFLGIVRNIDLKSIACDILKMVKFDIIFDHNGKFYAGSAVTGKFVLNLSQNTRING
jgi:hypothetical protein